MSSRFTDDDEPSKRKREDDEAEGGQPAKKQKSRWGDADDEGAKGSEWDEPAKEETTPGRKSRWDTPTPGKNRFDGGVTPQRSSRWDAPPTPQTGTVGQFEETPSRWGAAGGATPSRFGDTPSRFGATPSRFGDGGETPSRFGATPSGFAGDATPSRFGETPSRGGAWDATPAHGGATPSGARDWEPTPQRQAAGGETPTHMKWDAGAGAMPTPKKTKWDDTPMGAAADATPGTVTGATPAGYAGATPAGFMGATPAGFAGFTPAQVQEMPPEMYRQAKVQMDTNARNVAFSDEELDELLPSEGYEIIPFPESYRPITPARKKTTTPTPFGGNTFQLAEEAPPPGEGPSAAARIDVHELGPDLPPLKPEDYQYFSELCNPKPEDEMTKEEYRRIWIMKLLLKVKNGTPQQRKNGLKHLTEKARYFGAQALFEQILPLLTSRQLDELEGHVLVKLIGRILFKLGDLVRPMVRQILIVIAPMQVDSDFYARVEGREIISNLAKAAGWPTISQALENDIGSDDENVRNITARTLAVVTNALGIPALLPFLRAVCQAKKVSWLKRHTGIKIVQQIAILMGCGVLPHLRSLIDTVQHGLLDEQPNVKSMTALTLAALAEAAAPYGIECFDNVLVPLWQGVQTLRGKNLAAFLKAVGFLIPLMDAEYAEYYTEKVMPVLLEQMKTPDEEMKKIVLHVIKQCVSTDGVKREFIQHQVVPHFFKHFWVKRMAMAKRNYTLVVDATVAIAMKVGAADIIDKIVHDLNDENEDYRRMVMEAIMHVVEEMGTADVPEQLENKLIDGAINAFTEQAAENTDVILKGFATILASLGNRVAAYLPQIIGCIKYRFNNKNAIVRQQAAELVSRIAATIKACDGEVQLGHLGVVLYECLSEEFPEVLGSILAALKSIVNVIGMTKMTPPIRDLFPALTPILKNRHEKVQENCIDLVGRIADRAPEAVPDREWSRVCFELLELLKAHKKAIRRAAVNTFGYISKALGPSDVMSTLLSNLKVQERQQRVCTTVAIAIVAETTGPFCVIPSLMNEYRVPETNVQNGVLKTFSFLFEYIRETGADYCMHVLPLLEDALVDRDPVHRQIACNVVRHMALGVVGLECEDALVHLLNLVWPNIFETAPHMVNSCVEAIEACRVALGPGVILGYVLQGLFHPAKKVREMYWKLYNNIYIGGQHCLVPAYPKIPNEGGNTYTCAEVDVFI